MVPHRREAGLRLAPDPGNPVPAVKVLPRRGRLFPGGPGQFPLHRPRRHGVQLPVDSLRPVLPVQAAQGAAGQPQGEDSPLVGVHPPGGGQHPALRQLARPAQGGKGLRGGAAGSLPARPDALGKVGP